MVVASPFIVISMVFLIAFLMPLIALLFPNVRLPTAVLEIFGGVFVGKSGLHIVDAPEWMTVITQFGLLYLMFLAGLEIRLRQRKSTASATRLQEPLWLPALVSLVAVGAMALWAGQLLRIVHVAERSDVTALILATTSLGVVIPTLKEQGLINQPLGQVLLLSALLADFVTVALSSFVLRTTDHSSGNPGLQLVIMVLAGILIFLLGRVLLRLLSTRQAYVRASQIGVRGALAIMAIFGGLASVLQTEVILGGFIGGIVCSKLAGENHNVLRDKLEVLGYSLFLPLFFVTVGMQLDLSHVRFAAVVSNLPIYLVTAMVVKMGSALALRPFFTWRETLASGFLLSTRFTLVIAVAMQAEQLHLIDGTQEGTLVVMAMVTVFLSPLLFSLILS